MVFIKAERIFPKMAHIFSGPYRVVKDNTAGNYILENALGESMQMSYRRHKLKAVSDPSESEEVNLDISEILDQKVEKANILGTLLNGKIRTRRTGFRLITLIQ